MLLYWEWKGGTGMARVVKGPEERRQEILDAALALFCEKGYEKTSIADIARRLGISQGLCYRYFPSKEAVLDAAVDRYAREQVGRMAPVLCDEKRTLRQKLDAMPVFSDYESASDPCYAVCHGENNRRIHDQLSLRVCELLVPLVQKQLESARRRGEIAVGDTGDMVDTEDLASFLVYGQQGILARSDLSGEERAGRIRRLIAGLLGL